MTVSIKVPGVYKEPEKKEGAVESAGDSPTPQDEKSEEEVNEESQQKEALNNAAESGAPLCEK